MSGTYLLAYLGRAGAHPLDTALFLVAVVVLAAFHLTVPAGFAFVGGRR